LNEIREYLTRLRERYPQPRWINRSDALSPDKLPTPFSLDAIVRDNSLFEWRIVNDPLARLGSGAPTQPRSYRFADRLSDLARAGQLAGVGERLETLTISADRAGHLGALDERLLAAPPWVDGAKVNIDVVRIGDLILKGAPTLLTGPLGSGKSTYSRWLARTLANRRHHDPDSPLPIFLDIRVAASRLAELMGSDGLLTIRDLTEAVLVSLDLGHLNTAPLVAEWVAGRACLLVDGFDEVGVVLNKRVAVPLESAIARALGSLAEESPNILVSSRPKTSSIDEFDHFLEVEFAPLTLAESVSILDVFGKVGSTQASAVAAAIPEELRARPLFLSLVGRLLTQNSLPTPERLTRWTLLEASLRVLLDERLVDKDRRSNVEEILGCGYDTLVSVLQESAFEAQFEQPDGGALTIPRARFTELLLEADEDTDVSKVLKVLTREAGLMVSREKVLEFSHRAFQDLLTAGHLARLAQGDRVHGAILDAMKKASHDLRDAAELYVDHLSSDPRHRDNDLLDLSLAALDAAEQAEHSTYGGMCVWLAAIGLREVMRPGYRLSRRDAVVLDGFAQRAVEYVGDTEALSAPDRVLIADQLGAWGDTRDGVGLDDAGLPSHSWVAVGAGTMTIGLDEHRQGALDATSIHNFAREVPEAGVQLGEFAISRYPTTSKQFRAFLESPGGYAEARWWSGWARGQMDWGSESRLEELVAANARANAPVIGIDWYEAMAYCRWLGDRIEAAIDLPSEEEWEAAARGRAGTLFPWGDEFDGSLANWAGTGLGRVAPVGCFSGGSVRRQPAPFDMIGNVWEWTKSIAGEAGEDGFSRIGSAATSESTRSMVRRVVRGGSYLNEVSLLRSTYRGNDVASARFDRQGFRIVRRPTGGAALG
jgi:formylglycine-generating enzyme required for sulfatase activity